MTYNVFGGTLNLAHSLLLALIELFSLVVTAEALRAIIG